MTISVPFFDWAGLWAERAEDFGRIMTETAARGGFILQRDVDELEEGLAALLGVRHVVALSDGTNAIHLGLRASGVEQGDEIILPSHGFIAAAQAIHFAGATPVPVEMTETDWLIDPVDVERAITARTVGIMPVHVNGRICNMDALQAVADQHGLAIYEDAAQALGARYKGRAAGRFGEWGTFSFYPSKTLGCFGDAGALATDSDELGETVRTMRNHGANRDKQIPPDIAVWGTNSRLDNIHAAILVYKLSYYPEAIDRRREVAARYHAAFSGIDRLRLPPPPTEDGDYYDVFQNYELRVRESRDAVRQHLAEAGVGTIIQWGGTGMHQFTGLGFTQELPRTDQFFADSFLLPMNHILSDDQVDHVIATLLGYFDR